MHRDILANLSSCGKLLQCSWGRLLHCYWYKMRPNDSFLAILHRNAVYLSSFRHNKMFDFFFFFFGEIINKILFLNFSPKRFYRRPYITMKLRINKYFTDLQDMDSCTTSSRTTTKLKIHPIKLGYCFTQSHTK